MARPRAKQPTYYASRGAYYCWHNGKQVLCAVGPEGDKDTLDRAFKKWFDLQQEGLRGTRTDDLGVVAVLNIYLDHVKKHKKRKTYLNRRHFAQSFVNYAGKLVKELKVKDLTPAVVDDWCSFYEKERKATAKNLHGRVLKWTAASRYTAIGTMKAALTYCLDMGHIASNPLKGMKTPRKPSRTGRHLISEGQHERLLQAMRKRTDSRPFIPFLEVLKDTGCRPGELANLTAAEVKEDDGVLFLDLSDWKTEGKHAYRHIYLTERSEAIIRDLLRRHPTGPLFRNSKGGKWSEGNIIAKFERFRKSLEFPRTITAYSYRHAYATAKIKAGMPIKILAQLLGNSVAVIEQHYAHLLDDKAEMQRWARKF